MSTAGEFIGVFCGIAICSPLLYQLKGQLQSSSKPALPSYCWLLWSLGFFGIGSYFVLCPRPPGTDYLSEPESPRTLGCFGLLGSLACQVLWALDTVSPSADMKSKLEVLLKRLGPTLFLMCLVLLGISLVHGHVIKSRVLYRDFLLLVAYACTPCWAAAAVQGARKINTQHLAKHRSDVAGLHWIPICMQMLGFFAATFTCTLLYQFPDWHAVALLATYCVCDGVYIGIAKYRSSKATYDRLPS